MKKIILATAVATMLSAGAFIIPTAAQAQGISVQIGQPPPPPRVEHVPPPRKGYVWAPGHWEARHGRYAWTNGTWVRARPGYAYHAPEWREQGGRYVYRSGSWDRDHDGVPNQHDRRPDNPNRS
ncbi:YXWGXW repeat-containing protein [Variovorax robiniae]|uniref:YXWGXW repeat-containing protein n=1 Tax=Variovorax robiniae TaxID=1836199 RepID=A0ABU8X5E5_9BURK